MNPIEEMMKAAEVDTTIQKFNVVKKEWEVVGHKLPDFTPEKQLEVLKFIILHTEIDEIRQYYNEPSKTWNITATSLPEMGHTFSFSGCNADYAFCLAELMATFCQILTPAQKQQIKEILEDDME